MTTFTGTPGTDTFNGSSSQQDVFFFSVANLSSSDTVNGGTGAFFDQLRFTTAGAVTAGMLSHVSHIEQLLLANGTNSLTLTDALVGSSDLGTTLKVYGGTGNDTIDGSAVTTAANRIQVYAGTGNDFVTGGAGVDTFLFAASALTGSDTVNGGGSTADKLQLTTAGTLGASAFSHVTHVESLQLAAGSNNITLNDAMISASDTSHTLTVMDSSGNDIVSGGAVGSANHIVFKASTGNDILTGGDGADTFYFAPANLDNNDVVNGGTGSAVDTLVYTAGIIGSVAQNVSNIEKIALANGADNEISFTDSLVSTSNNQTITVLGGTGNDQIDGSGLTAANKEILYGRGGADSLFAGAGKDIFAYLAVSESNGSGGGNVIDVFHAFNATVDKIDLAGTFKPTAVNTVSGTHALSHATFDADVAAAVGGSLGAHEAAVFTASGGDFDLNGTYLVVNPTGTTGYAAGQDYVFDVSGSLNDGPFTTGTFI